MSPETRKRRRPWVRTPFERYAWSAVSRTQARLALVAFLARRRRDGR